MEHSLLEHLESGDSGFTTASVLGVEKRGQVEYEGAWVKALALEFPNLSDLGQTYPFRGPRFPHR